MVEIESPSRVDSKYPIPVCSDLRIQHPQIRLERLWRARGYVAQNGLG